jgi:hypothetical protein
MALLRTLLASSICTLAGVLGGCADECNGHIESTVLYFKEAPNHQGQLVYANVANKSDLGIKQTLMRDDKEFGTFGNVVIIVDPQSKFKGRRTICFDTFTAQKTPVATQLDEERIPRLELP